jgi:hypothetical protein
VDHPIFRVRAICAIVSSRLSRIAIAAASSSGVMTLGRPPWRPRARAASRPAADRSPSLRTEPRQRDVGLEATMWRGDGPGTSAITVDVRGLHGVP